MEGLLFLFGLFLALGLFFLTASVLKLPTMGAAKAMLGTVKQERKAAKTLETYFMILAVRLSGFIRMDAYKRSRMQNVLKASGMNMTPEVYQAYALVKSGAVLLGAIPCMFLFPLLVPVVVVLALLLYFKENQKADETLKAKREEIEGELPRMVATMEQELKASRNVIGMLERFKGNAGPALTGELDILLADMRSSNYEAALTRFEARLNSPMLSDVVRGLIGVLRGDDSTVYFQMLAHDFKQIELQRLKAQGKSYLLKLLLTNLRESGMHICALDPEMEYEDLTNNLGGCFIDLMSGEFIINPLEPKTWDEAGSPEDLDAPQTFRIRSRLSQHISFLKDFFRSYKDFSDREIDVIEIMLQKLYTRWGITDESDFECLAAEDYPVLSDLYAFIEEEYQGFDENRRQLYTAEMIQSILLGLNSMCVGAESKFFNGHTNITDDGFITFGVKGLLQASRSLKNALLFNVLSFMSDVLLTQGNTAASLDEFYLFLSNLTAVEYVRNFMKRVRKKDSAVIIASQNLEDFNLDGVREYTKPLFSIPTHQFLFNAGSIDAKFYTDTLQLEDSEYNLIRYPQRGVCLYKCGNERYNLMVNAPEHKARLFGKAGGR